MPSDHSSSRVRSSGATPSWSPIMIIGSIAATSVTKSHSPRSITESMISSAAARTAGSLPRTCFGVKPLFTRRRRRLCSGSSMSIIIGSAKASGRQPSAFEKRSGWRDTSRTSS